MGCNPSNVQERFQRTKMVSIIDRNFLRSSTVEKEFLSLEKINYKVYQQVEDFARDLPYRYINAILTSKEYLPDILKLVNSLELSPFIYVTGNVDIPTTYQNIKKTADIFDLADKLQNQSKIITNIVQQEQGKQIIDYKCSYIVAILRRNCKAENFALAEKMLLQKQISYKVYHDFNLLFTEIEFNAPYFILSQDLFALQISKILQNKKTKLFSYAPSNEKTFTQMAYFYSNDLADIVHQIQNEIIQKDMISTPCTKAFIYSVGLDYVLTLQQLLLKNKFQVRTVDNLDQLIGSVLSLFAMTLFVEQSEVKNVQKKMMEINFLYKTKIIVIRNIQFNNTNMNKQIKQLKKGYKLTKQVCKEVDIVDKNCDSPAFMPMKDQLQKHNMIVNLYRTSKQYTNRPKAHSEMLICSLGEKAKISQYINNQHLRVKLIIYCPKSKMSQDLLNDKRFAMVDWNFTRIVKYLLATKVFYPRITNFTNRSKRVQQVVQKLKNTNRRVSIQKWSNTTTQLSQFVILDAKASKSQIAQVQRSAGEIWKLEYDPIKNLSRIKVQFVESLKQLKKIYKVKLQDMFFSQLTNKLSWMNVWQFIKQISTMFQSSNTITMFINNSLCKLEQILPAQILHLKQFMVITSLSSLSYFQIPLIKKMKLVCWLPKFDDQYTIGSIYLNKKFQIFYEESKIGLEEGGKYKLEIDVNFDKVDDKLFEYNNLFQYKSKYICMPYTKFRLQDKKVVSGDKQYTVIKFSLIKDNQYVKTIIQNNLNPQDGIYKIFSNPSLVNSFKMKQKQQSKQSQIQQITTLLYIHKANYSESITHCLNAIKLSQENQQIVNPIIISQLLYMACYIYYQLEKLEQCKKYLMACLRMQPNNYLKQKVDALKQKLKGKTRASKLIALQNSMMMSQLKPGEKNKQLDVFSDVHALHDMSASMGSELENIEDKNPSKKRKRSKNDTTL